MNQISTKASTALEWAPASPGRELALTVARISNAVRQLTWNHCEIAAERAPTADERAAIAQRRAELETALTPTDKRSAVSAITGMMLGFGGGDANLGPETLLARVEVYVESVADQPIWAIRKACRDWRDGRHGAGAFVPSTAQFAPTVAAETLPFRNELARLRAILDAKVVSDPSPEVRAKTAAMGLEAAAKMREEHEARRERAAVNSLDAMLAKAQPNMTPEERAAHIGGIGRRKETGAPSIGELASDTSLHGKGKGDGG